MSADASVEGRPKAALKSPTTKRIILAVIIVVVIVLMGFGTKVVSSTSAAANSSGAFSASAYGKTTFPKVQKAIEKRAVSATTLASAIASDQAAAEKKYGVPATTGTVMSVSFTGVAGTPQDGVYPVTVAGVPSTLQIRVQTDAINGTDLRDATGTIKFGQFTNQIDYQNAGAALNKQMKQTVLSKVDAANLEGKTISVVGVFELINPNGWLVTPAKLSVK